MDWRIGARHFLDLLVDGDVANNQLNWQWMAGTGTDSRPNRVLNPRHPGEAVRPRRRVRPALGAGAGGAGGPAIHEPWKLSGPARAALDYPDPIVELSEGLDRFRRARERR